MAELDWDNDGDPLFADNSDDEDDPPPLPPPMPPLSQLTHPHDSEGVDDGMGSGDRDGPSAGGEHRGGEQDAPQKKRAPILTLTIDRIFSDKGLPYLEKEFPKLKFKGKGHEVSDLKYLLQQYEHWANAMYPKLTFKDVTDRIQRLATKKEFKSQLIQMRRRWARGPTPPVPDDEEDDITSHHHDDTPSQQHQNGGDPSHQDHHGNSPTHQPNLSSCPSTHIPTSHLDSEEEQGEEGERGRGQTEGGSEGGNKDEGGFDLDSLLMREEDIVREREQQSRKRAREGGASEEASGLGDMNSSTEQDQGGGLGQKKSKHSWEDDDLDELLTQEEHLLSEMATYDRATEEQELMV